MFTVSSEFNKMVYLPAGSAEISNFPCSSTTNALTVHVGYWDFAVSAHPFLAFGTLRNMAVQLTIEVDQKIVITTFAGEITDEDILGVRSLICSHPDFDASFSEILDFSGVTVANLSTSAIELVSQRASNFNLKSMHIFVAPQDFLFGLARMSQTFAGATRPNSVVVRTVDEARKFLGQRNAGSD